MTEMAVVDGSNVAHAEQGSGARLANIRVVCARLEAEGLRPVVLADASLRQGARVVSNDRFRKRASAFPDVLDRVIRFMIVNGEVVLDRRGRRRPD